MKKNPELKQENSNTISGFSFPFGIPLVVYPILLIIAGGGSKQWYGVLVSILFIILNITFTIYAFKKSSFIETKKKYVHLNRTTWILNWFLFFGLIPFIIWLLLGLYKPLLKFFY